MEEHFLLSTGQMANIHKINKRTLMYYDEIGLFSPAVKNNNGYRFYTYAQCSTLETILSLRGLDMPISEILTYMSERSPEKLLMVLKNKENEALLKIKKLEQVYSLLNRKSAAIQSSLNTISGSISMEACEEEHYMISPKLSDDSDETVVSMLSESLQRLHDRHLFCHSYGSMISSEDIEEGRFNVYSHFFLKVSHDISYDNVFVKPKGCYLQMYWRGNWESIPEAYSQIMKYVQSHHLKLTGYAYEENVIDDFATQDSNQYMTKIMIAVVC